MKIRAEEVQIVGIDELVPHPKNMHKHSKEQIDRLCKLIEYQGWRVPIIVQKGTNFIVSGHGRYMAAKQLGIKGVPVIYQEFESEEQLYAFIVSDNAIGKDTWASLDLSQVNQDILELGPELDLDMLGLKDFAVEPIEKFEPVGDEEAIPEVQEPITKRGDVWLLGDHRVMCGDSTMIDDVEKLMKGEKADMVFTDPPYGINIDFGEKFASQNGNGVAKRNNYKKIKNDENTQVANDVISLILSLDIEKILIWGANYYTELLGNSRCWISWYKKDDLPDDTFCDTELAWTNLDKHSKTIPVKWKEMIKEGEMGSKRVHPNQKPVLLVEKCFDYMEAGKNVIDLFLGSGSTLIACEKTGRKCYGMELDEYYCDVIIKRWQQYTGKDAILESTGETYNQKESK